MVTRMAFVVVLSTLLAVRPGPAAAQSLYHDQNQSTSLEVSLGESFHADGTQHLGTRFGVSVRGQADLWASLIDRQSSRIEFVAIGTRVLAHRQGGRFPASVFLQGEFSMETGGGRSIGNVFSLGLGVSRFQDLGRAWSFVPSWEVEIHSVFDRENVDAIVHSMGPSPLTVDSRSGRTRMTTTASIGVLYRLRAISSVFLEPTLRMGAPDEAWGIRLGLLVSGRA